MKKLIYNLLLNIVLALIFAFTFYEGYSKLSLIFIILFFCGAVYYIANGMNYILSTEDKPTKAVPVIIFFELVFLFSVCFIIFYGLYSLASM